MAHKREGRKGSKVGSKKEGSLNVEDSQSAPRIRYPHLKITLTVFDTLGRIFTTMDEVENRRMTLFMRIRTSGRYAISQFIQLSSQSHLLITCLIRAQ